MFEKGAAMGKELTGQGGYAVGSPKYFRTINEKTFMTKIIKSNDGFAYYDCIATLSDKICNAFDEIYGDLQKTLELFNIFPKRSARI